LIRCDILVVVRRSFDLVKEEQIRLTAERPVGIEEELKYRKRYATVWRKTSPMCMANVLRLHQDNIPRES